VFRGGSAARRARGNPDAFSRLGLPEPRWDVAQAFKLLFVCPRTVELTTGGHVANHQQTGSFRLINLPVGLYVPS